MRPIASAVAAFAAVITFASAAAAQTPAKRPVKATIDPGMSKADVIAHLGRPASERTRGEFTYVYYVNGMEKKVGMSDIVTLQNDKVVDAIFRSPNRAYSGTSSSPRAITAAEARKARPPVNKGGASTD